MPKQKKKQHLCHHYGAAGHTRPNCYKWLATQKSNSVITSRDQNQLPSSFSPLGDLLKAPMFISNLKGFNSSPSPPNQGFSKRKGSSKVWKENGSKWFCHFFSPSPSCFCFCITCVFCFIVLSQSSFMYCFVLFNIFCLISFQFCFILFFKIKIKNWKIQKQCVYVYIGTSIPWMAIETKFSKLCISCNLDEHLYA